MAKPDLTLLSTLTYALDITLRSRKLQHPATTGVLEVPDIITVTVVPMKYGISFSELH